MNDSLTIRTAGVDDLLMVERLAYEIWPGTYGHILSAGQLNYMLQMIYNQPTLQKQMQEEQHNFLMADLNGQTVGFADYSLYAPGVYKLHKIYVHGNTQGKGIGKQLIDHIIQALTPLGAHTLRLNVNRHNNAKQFYEKLGFKVSAIEDIDIGNGYFMNDFVMEKELGN